MSAPTAGLRVLLVDDDPEQRALVRRLLEHEGFTRIDEAGDGGAALDTAGAAVDAGDPYDLVVLDLVMPGRSGYEVLPELQERTPSTRIVVLSNLPRAPLEPLVRQRGALGFVEKRVAPSALVGEILMVAAIADAVTLGATTSAAREARRFVRGALSQVDGSLLDSVELLVSELVTNAVIHASTAPRLAVRLSPTTVRVEVHDDDPRLPAPLPPDDTRVGGRGLFIVDQVATRWAAEPSPSGGKVVWFELARAAR